jgi:hypothetical protein
VSNKLLGAGSNLNNQKPLAVLLGVLIIPQEIHGIQLPYMKFQNSIHMIGTLTILIAANWAGFGRLFKIRPYLSACFKIAA